VLRVTANTKALTIRLHYITWLTKNAQTSRRKTHDAACASLPYPTMSNNNPLSLLADHFVVVGSAVSGGGFLLPPVHHVNTFFSVFLPPSFRPIGGEKKRTGDRSQVLGNRVSASLMKGI
jgi:hypothetical protein